MAVGDVTSTERGSGARFNDGKLPMDLIPVRVWLTYWTSLYKLDEKLHNMLVSLAEFQEGNNAAIDEAIAEATPELMDKTVEVLVFGAKKYAEWNWAKGMAWGVPVGCILRHTRSILEKDEELDPESGLPHIAHVVCNLVMLAWFVRYYPEGDNRPPTN